ncbi:MAG: class I SAM-dependent methyltransferase [Patescibacteria group bacterium]
MDNKNKNAIDIYNLIAKDYAAKFDQIESEDDLKFDNIFLSHLKLGSNILDLGCGTGFSTDYFIQKGMKSQGIDLSTSMIDIAKKNYPKLTFLVADMRVFKPSEMMDAVWAGYSLFHFEQIYLEQTIENIKSYLRPHGILGLVIQGGSGEIESREPFLPEKTIYIHLYTKEEMIEILTIHGFEVIGSSINKAADFEFPYEG